jgi:hypothetical protein
VVFDELAILMKPFAAWCINPWWGMNGTDLKEHTFKAIRI